MNLLTAGLSEATGRDTAGNAQDVSKAGIIAIIVDMVAGGAAGTPDDIDVFANGGLFGNAAGKSLKNFVILDAFGDVNSAVPMSTLQFFSLAGGAGTARTLPIASDVAGRVREGAGTFQSIANRTVSATDKLFLRRSDRSSTGRVTLLCATLD